MGDTQPKGKEQVRALTIMGTATSDALLAQRGHLIGWVPVCLGIGIGLYFLLNTEPPAVAFIGATVLAGLLVIVSRLISVAYAPVLVAIALVLAGMSVAKFRTDMQAAPVLSFRYYGPIEGRIVAIDRSGSDAQRLTLDQVVLARMAPDRTPARVRVSLHGNQPYATHRAGDRIILTGHLSPPSGPAEPGGFDFQRHAWFDKLGALGYTRAPVLRLRAANEKSLAIRIFALRIGLSRAVQAALPGETGAFAAAIMTGDRSAMGQETLRNLRASNLAHLLAISGLHMGLLTAFIFGSIRGLLVLIPGVGLRWPVKKIAAACAIVAGAAYLALSGGNVATERAFIMIAVMFVAVLLGRRALTMRAVAMAAVIVLVIQPESLIGPGFQMSFAATTALVAVFGALRSVDMTRIPKWARPVLSVVISSFVAGLATAPFAAVHFNQIAHYGLIANLLSVPLMGVMVMPAAVLAVCLAPLGLWQIGLTVMGWGLDWILFVARSVAEQEGALGHVVFPMPVVLPLLALGLLFVTLWHGPARWGGVVAASAAFGFWSITERPAVLVADSGGLIGHMTHDGRALSKPRGDGFVAGVWLENDGWPVAQETAHERDGIIRAGRVATLDLGRWRILQTTGKTALAGIAGCGGADVLITNQSDPEDRPCLAFDIDRLRATGSLAFDLADNGTLVLTTARHFTGQRPWNMTASSAGQPTMFALPPPQQRSDAPLLSQVLQDP
ncbi:ComEC/Rec2 family competence protein [Yoonia sp. 208BN28-4]|uniref:ComEC/Rec2 family competence protein n=1 Tax=Yoonia sp. 208BN28-4 TaxID=3126505 RepID=UPI0030B1ADF4